MARSFAREMSDDSDEDFYSPTLATPRMLSAPLLSGEASSGGGTNRSTLMSGTDGTCRSEMVEAPSRSNGDDAPNDDFRAGSPSLEAAMSSTFHPRFQRLTAHDEASRPFYLKTFWKLTLLIVALYVFLGGAETETVPAPAVRRYGSRAQRAHVSLVCLTCGVYGPCPPGPSWTSSS